MYLPFSGLRTNPTLHLRHGLETCVKVKRENSYEREYNREIFFVW